MTQCENNISVSSYIITHGLCCPSYFQQKEQQNQVSLGAGQDNCTQSAFPQPKCNPSDSRIMLYHLLGGKKIIHLEAVERLH